GLTAKRRSGARQAIEWRDRCRRQLTRVIEVGVHEYRMIFLHHLAELRRDPFRQMRGNSASDADDLDVRNSAKLLEEILQSSIAQHHRVPAAHDYVADLGVLAQILKSRLVLIER